MTSIKNYYVIDSCSLMELNRKYPMDIFPPLWHKIESLISKGFLVSPKEVLKEIERGDDHLKEWARRQTNLFKDLTPKQIHIVKELLAKYPKWLNEDSMVPIADPFVIALAIEMETDAQATLIETIKKRIVVSEERMSGKKTKVPYVCQEYDIECIFLIEMFRKEGWVFN
ncbi:MAG TPA: DUF4411 family protein [Candidatus Nanoarchaeia archaeon]|nr:DUF4411 family protein [Candidatus Nanoarchaeia archaeon]